MTTPAQPIYRRDYQAPNFAIDAVTLSVDIFADHSLVTSSLELRRCGDASADLVLDGEDLDTLWLELDGTPLSAEHYQISDNRLTIPGLGARATLRSQVRLRPQDNSELSGFYQSGSTLCTQCEAEGFRRITWYLDRPDVMSRFRVSMSAEQERFPILLSNGNRLSSSDLGDGRHQVCWEDPHPKPAYLFAMVAGKLDCVSKAFTTCSGRSVACEIYVEPGQAERAHYALESLHHSMRWDEERYGREYDLDLYMIVAVSTFNMGAMENKGLNIFNAKYVLASDDTATDSDFEGVEGVIAHEYFHNWTGNRITCRDWFQLTLKEGLTVFRDQQFSADRTSHAVKRIDEVRLLRSFQFPEDAGPMAHPIRPESYVAMDNFYTATVYNKGAEVIRMYHTLLGPEGFRRGMDLYFERHDGQAVTCDDFRAAMADANGRDLSQFERWYDQAGTPTVQVETRWDAAIGTLHVCLRQLPPSVAGQGSAQAYHIPVRIAAFDQAGGALTLRQPGQEQGAYEQVLECTTGEQHWAFIDLDDCAGTPVCSLLRDFSAPVRLEYEQDFAELSILAAHDSDPFNRWQATQDVARRVLLADITRVSAGEEPSRSPILHQVFAATLAAEDLDGAPKALAMGLPGDSELAMECSPVPVEAIARVRRFHEQDLAAAHRSQLSELYAALADTDPMDRGVVARQRRRLRHACLGYLALLGGSELDRAAEHYRQAGNMTEMVAALKALAQHSDERRDAAFAHFYQRFQGDDLVIDKWFSLQATADAEDTMERILALREHPDFTLSNPNRVRSLASALALANHSQFHRADGQGYAFIGDLVIALAQRNPQLAARLSSSLNHWRRYDEQRQQAMHEQLLRIRAAEPSRDVREIIDRALNAPPLPR